MIIESRPPNKHDLDVPPSEESPQFRFCLYVTDRPDWVPMDVPDTFVTVSGVQSFNDAEPEATAYFIDWMDKHYPGGRPYEIRREKMITDSKAQRYEFRRPNGESWLASGVRTRVEQELSQMRAALTAIANTAEPAVDVPEPYDYIALCIAEIKRLRELAAAALNTIETPAG